MERFIRDIFIFIMTSFFGKKRNIIISLVVVAVILAGGGYWYINSRATPSFSTVAVTKGTVTQSIDEPANVKTEQSAAIAFQEGGQIAAVDVHEGSVVAQGTTLATLDASQFRAALAQANAGVAAAQAKLAGLESGTRPQQIQVDEAAVANARAALGVAVNSAYSAANDAIENQTDNLFSNPKTNNPIFLVDAADSQTTNNIEATRVTIGLALAQWYQALSQASSSAAQATLSGTADAVLSQINSYINQITLVVNGAPAAAQLTSAQLSEYKAYVATARAEVEKAIGTNTGDEAALTSAQKALALAQAGATPQDIQAAQAAAAQAQAAAESAQVALNNATLTAPFSGTVQNLTAQVGQVVSPGAPVLTLVNQSGLKIETYVPQTDIANVKVGDAAKVTLDAFGTGTIFPARVTTIDPGETQVNGAPAYLVTLHFTGTPKGVKDGMSGDVRIIEKEHVNVLEVPTNLIIQNGTSSFVLIEKNGSTVQQSVTTGAVGDHGMTEITSGLTEGQRIVQF